MIRFFKTITDNNLKIFRKPVIASIFKSIFQGQPVFVLLMVMLELLQPLIESGTELNVKRLIMLCIWLLASLVLLFILQVITYRSNSISFRLAAGGRLKLGDHLRKLSMGFFKSKDPGDLTSLMLADYTNFENYLGMLLMDALPSIFLPIVFLVFLLPIDWRMTLITLSPIPIAVIAAVFTNAVIISRTGKKHIDAKNETTSRMLEYLDGMKNIKAFNLHGEKFERLQRSFKNLKKISIKQEALGGPLAMLGIWFLKAGIALIMITGISFVVRGSLSLPYFLLFLILGTRVYDPLSGFMVSFLEMCYVSLSVKRLQEVHDTPPLPSPEEAPAPQACDIEFDHVWFHYHETDVLKDVSFKLPQNTMTALVGHSGSGKSTITRLIARFWDVNKGQVKLGGRPVSEYKAGDLLSQVSMVFQDVYLFNDTILNNIRVGRGDATMDEVLAAAEKARCREFIEKLPGGFDTMVGEGGATLSGGEKQRVSIARAILKNAPIILLDEATASLDPENELYIQEAISELIKDRTLVVIAHRLSTITHADQILVLKNGGIAERGTHDGLLSSNGVYSGMWNEQKYAHNWKVGSADPELTTG